MKVNNMPTMAAITVKKYDGTTDQIWTNVQAAAGDGSFAIWRNQSVGIAAAFQPEMRVKSRSNGDGSVRRVEGQIDWKQSATGTDNITRKVNTGYFKFEAVCPQGMPTADNNEFSAQLPNLVGSALFKAMLKEGFAPT